MLSVNFQSVSERECNSCFQFVQKQFSELLMKAASDYGALTASVADFQWSQNFEEPPSVWGESFAALQKLRVGHFDSPVPRTPARDPSQRLPGVSDCLTPPPWKTEANFDDLSVRNQRRQEFDQQVEDADS
ncbi:hypothetical protein RIF29_15167 [Crotalaria pallida]|uniref:Uncharacterized protein n=1 Tax=Crotalaria pallida TaxID=3830 RepID=A0AAN9FD32_CROPI